MPGLKSPFAATVLALACAAQGQEAPCTAPAKPLMRAEMYFGRNIGGHLGVGARQWARFVARELTPRFPGGFTVIDGQGQWRGPSGAIVHEPSKIVIVFAPDNIRLHEAVAAAAVAYKQRFKQDSVAVVTRPVCVAF